MKKYSLILVLITAVLLFSCSYAEESMINCVFDFNEEYAQIGKPFSFSYMLSGGSGSYSNVEIEAEFVTVHDSIGNDVDIQFFEMDTQSSGTVTITPTAGSGLILWLRGQDAGTGEEFYFECHQGWISVKPNQDIKVTFQYNHEEAVVGQMFDLQYRIEGISGISEAKIWWQIGSESFGNERLNEQSLSLLSGTTSLIPSYGEYIYAVIQGKDNTNTPFYAESEHLKLNNTELEEITCTFSFPDNNPRIGTPYTFSYMISGGSGSYSDINVEAEFVTVYDSRGNDVDIQFIELGSSSASNVSFTPKAGTGLILWLRGKDAITQQSFVFECHNGWMAVESNPVYPVSFVFEKDNYLKGEPIKVDYQIENLDTKLNKGKLWWTLISDFYIEDHLNEIDIVESCGSAEIIPSYGKVIYAVLEGTDQAGNPIYAESKQMIFGKEGNAPTIPSDSSEEGDLFPNGTNPDNLLPVTVPTMILPRGSLLPQDLMLKFDRQRIDNRQSIKYDVRLVDIKDNDVVLLNECLLIFPYPEEMDMDSGSKYHISIYHYKTNEIEVFDSEDGTIKLLPQGLSIYVSSLSPFVIEWEERPEIDIPKTGDDSYIALWVSLLILAGVSMRVLKRKTA